MLLCFSCKHVVHGSFDFLTRLFYGHGSIVCFVLGLRETLRKFSGSRISRSIGTLRAVGESSKPEQKLYLKLQVFIFFFTVFGEQTVSGN